MCYESEIFWLLDFVPFFFRKSIPICHNHALFLGHQYQKNKN